MREAQALTGDISPSNPSPTLQMLKMLLEMLRKDSVIDEHPIYRELSADGTVRRKRYREFVKGAIKARKAMKGEIDRRMIYGNKDFADVIKRKYELEALVKPKGRRKKDEQ